jgi:hypothetical protein
VEKRGLNCSFNPDFPKLDRLREIVKDRNSLSTFRQGLRVPLKLHIQPKATFWIQPSRFVKDSILSPLTVLIDQFVEENVLVADHNRAFAGPLVVVHKKDGGIRMAVDYREVNQQLDTTANQIRPTLFDKLRG